MRQAISRENDYGQAGARYRAFSDWEREELIANLVAQLTPCGDDIKERMIAHLTQCDADYGSRVAAGLGHSTGMPVATGNGQMTRALAATPVGEG